MRWTMKELTDICEKKNITMSIQGGNPSGFLNQVETPAKSSSPKYRNKKVYIYENGAISQCKDESLGNPITVYDSQKEYTRHRELKLLEAAGAIRELACQVPILIQEQFVYDGKIIKAIIYMADFSYIMTNGDGRRVVEDVKGFDAKTGKFITTKDFKLKWKLLKCKYPEYNFVLY